MSKNTTVGIDIGTHQVKVVVAELVRDRNKKNFPKILGTGFAQSKGLRHGYIINSGDISKSIISAVNQAEQSSGIKIKKVYLSIGGIGIEEILSKSEVMVSRADSEISDLDINKAIDDSEEKIRDRMINRKIIHTIPIKYRIDGQEVLGRPYGMKGTKFEVETLFVTCLEQHLNDLINTIEGVGIEVEDVMTSSIAGSFVTLSKAQKIAGCVLANIGAETVSVVVFENNIPISLKVFSIGGADITNDIALGLKVSLEEAERIKLGALTGTDFPRKQLEEIVIARLSDIFELIESHLKKIGKSKMLPAGIILTGGGSGIATIEDLARASLKLPSKIASMNFGNSPNGVGQSLIKDSSWAVAYGLCIWGLTMEEEPIGVKFAKKTGGNLISWLKQFLP